MNNKCYIYDASTDGVREREQNAAGALKNSTVTPRAKQYGCVMGNGRLSQTALPYLPILFTNIRNRANKFHSLSSAIDTCDAKIIALTETCLPAHMCAIMMPSVAPEILLSTAVTDLHVEQEEASFSLFLKTFHHFR